MPTIELRRAAIEDRTSRKTIDGFAAGDTLVIDVRIPAAEVGDDRYVVAAWLTIKATETDVDPGLLQVVGTILDAGSAADDARLRFTLTAVETAGLSYANGAWKWYDVQTRRQDGAFETEFRGRIGGEEGITDIGGEPVDHVDIAPASLALTSAGQTGQVTGTPKRADDTTIVGEPVSYRSTNTTVATVNAGTGLVTAVGDGTADIIATAGGVDSPAAPVTVTLVGSVDLAPASFDIIVGGTVDLVATVESALGAPLAGRVVTAQSDLPGIASVQVLGGGVTDADGQATVRVTGVALGAVVITASSEGHDDTAAGSIVADPSSLLSAKVVFPSDRLSPEVISGPSEYRTGFKLLNGEDATTGYNGKVAIAPNTGSGRKWLLAYDAQEFRNYLGGGGTFNKQGGGGATLTVTPLTTADRPAEIDLTQNSDPADLVPSRFTVATTDGNFTAVEVQKDSNFNWQNAHNPGWWHYAAWVRGIGGMIGASGSLKISGPGGVSASQPFVFSAVWQLVVVSVFVPEANYPASGTFALNCKVNVPQAGIQPNRLFENGTSLSFEVFNFSANRGKGAIRQALYAQGTKKLFPEYGDLRAGALGVPIYNLDKNWFKWSDDQSNAVWTRSGWAVTATAVEAPDFAETGNTLQRIVAAPGDYIEQGGAHMTLLSSTAQSIAGPDNDGGVGGFASHVAAYVQAEPGDTLPTALTARLTHSVSGNQYSVALFYEPTTGCWRGRIPEVATGNTGGTWTVRLTNTGAAFACHMTRLSFRREGYDSNNRDESDRVNFPILPPTTGRTALVYPGRIHFAPQEQVYTVRRGTIMLDFALDFDPATDYGFALGASALALNDGEYNGSSGSTCMIYMRGKGNHVFAHNGPIIYFQIQPNAARVGVNLPADGRNLACYIPLVAGDIPKHTRVRVDVAWDEWAFFSARLNLVERITGAVSLGSVAWEFDGRAYPYMDRDQRNGGVHGFAYMAARVGLTASQRNAAWSTIAARQALDATGALVAA